MNRIIIQIIACLLLFILASTTNGQTVIIQRQQQSKLATQKKTPSKNNSTNWYSLRSIQEGLAIARGNNYNYGFIDKSGKTISDEQSLNILLIDIRLLFSIYKYLEYEIILNIP